MANTRQHIPVTLHKNDREAISYLHGIEGDLDSTAASVAAVVAVPIGAGVAIPHATYAVPGGSTSMNPPNPDPAIWLKPTGQTISRADWPEAFTAWNIPAGTDQVTFDSENVWVRMK